MFLEFTSIWMHVDLTQKTFSHETCFKIVLRRKWSRNKVKAAKWSTTLSPDHPLYVQLTDAYKDLGMCAALVHKKLEFFDSISYSVQDGSESACVRVNVGDIVSVPERREGIAYAKVIAIIRHQTNEGRYFAFFLFQWFTRKHYEVLVDCPVYEIEEDPNSDEWRRLFPLNLVDHTSPVHFVHACRKGECTREQHDPENRRYIRNEFFYHAV